MTHANGLCLDPCFDLAITIRTLLCNTIQNFSDHASDIPKLPDAETARRPRRCAEADTGGYDRFLRVEWDTVLVAGNVCPPQRCFGSLPVSSRRRRSTSIR